MTTHTLAATLRGLEDVLTASRSTSTAYAAGQLAKLLEARDDSTIGRFIKSATPAVTTEGGIDKPIAELLPTLSSFQKVLTRVASKSAAKEFGSFIDWLRPFADMGMSAFTAACESHLSAPISGKGTTNRPSAIRMDLVAGYVSLIKMALDTNSKFDELFERLRGDSKARKQEVAEIAKQIMPEVPRNADRKTALKAILQYCSSARGFDLKLKAMSGRSAA